MDKNIAAIIGLTVVILAGIIAFTFRSNSNATPYADCVQHSLGLSMHVHSELEIYFDDQKQTIPANIGITPECMKALHTHDESGKIHIEHPQAQEFKLWQFFTNWGQPFSKDQILDKKIDATHTITMTVDGQPSEAFGDLVLKDDQKIVIRYQTKP